MPDPESITVYSVDADSGEELGTRTIRNDYCLVTHGTVYLDGVQRYGNGTVVLTLKRRKGDPGEGGDGGV